MTKRTKLVLLGGVVLAASAGIAVGIFGIGCRSFRAGDGVPPRPTPDLAALEILDGGGRKVALADLKGKPVLIKAGTVG